MTTFLDRLHWVTALRLVMSPHLPRVMLLAPRSKSSLLPIHVSSLTSRSCVIYQNQGTPESASEVSASTVPGCTAGTGPTSTSGPDTSSGVGVSTIEPSTTGSAPSYTVSPVSVSATSYTVSPVSSVSATGSTSVPAASVSATPGVGPTVSSNGTGSTQPGGPVSTGSAAPTGITTIPGSATSSGAVTPVSPTPSPSQFTNGAVAQTGSFVAGIGMFAAYFL